MPHRICLCLCVCVEMCECSRRLTASLSFTHVYFPFKTLALQSLYCSAIRVLLLVLLLFMSCSSLTNITCLPSPSAPLACTVGLSLTREDTYNTYINTHTPTYIHMSMYLFVQSQIVEKRSQEATGKRAKSSSHVIKAARLSSLRACECTCMWQVLARPASWS